MKIDWGVVVIVVGGLLLFAGAIVAYIITVRP